MASARFFQDNNFGGRNLLLDNPSHDRYLLAPFDFINAHNFNDLISSMQLRSSTRTIPSSVLLFQDARFSGQVKGFAYRADRDISSLPDFNDRTSSIILMDHSANPTTSLALRTLAGTRLNTAIDQQLAGNSSVSRSGNVLLKFVIDLSEASLFGVDLMLIETPIKVHTGYPFGDYDAKIRYWINFFINSSHQVGGSVAAWGYWIEGGILTGSIESRLRPQVQGNIGTVETQLNNLLTELDFHEWSDVYLMPGEADPTADYTSSVDADCSIVLVQTSS
jgi:hypothetical protein